MPDDPRGVLEGLPVSEVWGVGPRLTPRLERLGIDSAWRLADADDAFLRAKFSVALVRTAWELRGAPVIEHEDPEELSQSVSCSRSFGRPVVELSELAEAVAHYTARAAEKLRKEGQVAAGANVYFQYFPEYQPRRLDGGFTSATVTFDKPTASTARMTRAITPKLKGIFIAGRRYKKAGVVFFGLESGAVQQPDLFSSPQSDERDERLSETLDKINRQFGKGTLFTLAEGVEKPWAMKREHLSPCYTTNWNQLLEVR